MPAKKKLFGSWSFLPAALAFLGLTCVLLSYESSLQNRHQIPISLPQRLASDHNSSRSIDRSKYRHDSYYYGKLNKLEYDSIDETLAFIQSSTIIKSSSINFKKYLLALEGSVHIVSLPTSLSSDAIHKCDTLKPAKPSLHGHQHSLEIRFPTILKDMAASALEDASLKRMLNPIWNNGGKESKEKSPLFYYVESYIYHAIYCTNKKNDKEDWTQRDPYWLDVSKYVTETAQWKENNGIDFMIPSSHPQSGPTKIHPASLNYLLRASFLRTDFDASGFNPKDIIVPYLSDQLPFGDKFKDDVLVSKRRNILLYFSGGNNPVHGFREALGAKILDYKTYIYTPSGPSSRGEEKVPSRSKFKENDIIYGIDKYNPAIEASQDYIHRMTNSKFCLIVRGDTTSSRRLYTAIATGCIPVIVSDWISLPYESLLNWDKIVLIFPESIINNIGSLVETLLRVSQEQSDTIRMRLREARAILLYDPSPHFNSKEEKGRLINPVTLALIDALIRRETYCRRLTGGSSSYCDSLLSLLE